MLVSWDRLGGLDDRNLFSRSSGRPEAKVRGRHPRFPAGGLSALRVPLGLFSRPPNPGAAFSPHEDPSPTGFWLHLNGAMWR